MLMIIMLIDARNFATVTANECHISETVDADHLSSVYSNYATLWRLLTDLFLDNMTDISLATFANAISWITYWFKFHWN